MLKKALVFLALLTLAACGAGEPLPVPVGTWQPVNESSPTAPATHSVAAHE